MVLRKRAISRDAVDGGLRADDAVRCLGDDRRVDGGAGAVYQSASGSGRIWKCTAMGVMPLPPS